MQSNNAISHKIGINFLTKLVFYDIILRPLMNSSAMHKGIRSLLFKVYLFVSMLRFLDNEP